MKKLKSIAIVTFIYLIGIMCVFAMSVRAEQISIDIFIDIANNL